MGSAREDGGNLTQLKRAGLLTTFGWDKLIWIQFTQKGEEYAASLGLQPQPQKERKAMSHGE